MPFSKSIEAYEDIQELFDQALRTEKGIAITCHSHAAAILFRSRFNYFRKLDRIENRKIHPEGDPRHGRSAYDPLVLRIPPKFSPDDNTLYIEPRGASGRVEVREL